MSDIGIHELPTAAPEKSGALLFLKQYGEETNRRKKEAILQKFIRTIDTSNALPLVEASIALSENLLQITTEAEATVSMDFINHLNNFIADRRPHSYLLNKADTVPYQGSQLNALQLFEKHARVARVFNDLEKDTSPARKSVGRFILMSALNSGALQMRDIDRFLGKIPAAYSDEYDYADHAVIWTSPFYRENDRLPESLLASDENLQTCKDYYTTFRNEIIQIGIAETQETPQRLGLMGPNTILDRLDAQPESDPFPNILDEEYGGIRMRDIVYPERLKNVVASGHIDERKYANNIIQYLKSYPANDATMIQVVSQLLFPNTVFSRDVEPPDTFREELKNLSTFWLWQMRVAFAPAIAEGTLPAPEDIALMKRLIGILPKDIAQDFQLHLGFNLVDQFACIYAGNGKFGYIDYDFEELDRIEKQINYFDTYFAEEKAFFAPIRQVLMDKKNDALERIQAEKEPLPTLEIKSGSPDGYSPKNLVLFADPEKKIPGVHAETRERFPFIKGRMFESVVNLALHSLNPQHLVEPELCVAFHEKKDTETDVPFTEFGMRVDHGILAVDPDTRRLELVELVETKFGNHFPDMYKTALKHLRELEHSYAQTPYSLVCFDRHDRADEITQLGAHISLFQEEMLTKVEALQPNPCEELELIMVLLFEAVEGPALQNHLLPLDTQSQVAILEHIEHRLRGITNDMNQLVISYVNEHGALPGPQLKREALVQALKEITAHFATSEDIAQTFSEPVSNTYSDGHVLVNGQLHKVNMLDYHVATDNEVHKQAKALKRRAARQEFDIQASFFHDDRLVAFNKEYMLPVVLALSNGSQGKNSYEIVKEMTEAGYCKSIPPENMEYYIQRLHDLRILSHTEPPLTEQEQEAYPLMHQDQGGIYPHLSWIAPEIHEGIQASAGHLLAFLDKYKKTPYALSDLVGYPKSGIQEGHERQLFRCRIIFDITTRQPPISMHSVFRETGLSPGIVKYHLSQLQMRGLISVSDGLITFPDNGGVDTAQLLFDFANTLIAMEDQGSLTEGLELFETFRNQPEKVEEIVAKAKRV